MTLWREATFTDTMRVRWVTCQFSKKTKSCLLSMRSTYTSRTTWSALLSSILTPGQPTYPTFEFAKRWAQRTCFRSYWVAEKTHNWQKRLASRTWCLGSLYLVRRRFLPHDSWNWRIHQREPKSFFLLFKCLLRTCMNASRWVLFWQLRT